jgi:hypothetical protein
MKPILQKLWAAFPDHNSYPTLEDLYTMLGGQAKKNINEPGFGPNGNTCASRLSVAFNKGGAPISLADATGAHAATITAADRSLIIYRVVDFRNYLLQTLGKPKIDSASPFDTAFRDRKGIIAFSVNWSGATGHIALWNGTTYREPYHDNYATYIDTSNPHVRTRLGELWELP